MTEEDTKDIRKQNKINKVQGLSPYHVWSARSSSVKIFFPLPAAVLRELALMTELSVFTDGSLAEVKDDAKARDTTWGRERRVAVVETIRRHGMERRMIDIVSFGEAASKQSKIEGNCCEVLGERVDESKFASNIRRMRMKNASIATVDAADKPTAQTEFRVYRRCLKRFLTQVLTGYRHGCLLARRRNNYSY